MFDVDPTLSRSRRLLISDDEENEKVDIRRFYRRSPVSFSPTSTPYLKNLQSAALPTISAASLQFVIFLDFNRLVDASHSLTLLDI